MHPKAHTIASVAHRKHEARGQCGANEGTGGESAQKIGLDNRVWQGVALRAALLFHADALQQSLARRRFVPGYRLTLIRVDGGKCAYTLGCQSPVLSQDLAAFFAAPEVNAQFRYFQRREAPGVRQGAKFTEFFVRRVTTVTVQHFFVARRCCTNAFFRSRSKPREKGGLGGPRDSW